VVTLDAFTQSMTRPAPPEGVSAALQALWWGRKGDWDKAHKLVMADSSREAAWVHAYLHRVEGDLPNAGYWYRQAGQASADNTLEAEWSAITEALLSRK